MISNLTILHAQLDLSRSSAVKNISIVSDSVELVVKKRKYFVIDGKLRDKTVKFIRVFG